MTGALESQTKAELGPRNPQVASLQGREGSLDCGGCLSGNPGLPRREPAGPPTPRGSTAHQKPGRAIYYDNTLEKLKKYTSYWCNYYSPLDDGSDKLLLAVCPEHNYTTIE